jgi:hypothetical protein
MNVARLNGRTAAAVEIFLVLLITAGHRVSSSGSDCGISDEEP